MTVRSSVSNRASVRFRFPASASSAASRNAASFEAGDRRVVRVNAILIRPASVVVGSFVYRLVVIAAEVRIVLAPTVARAAFGGGVELFMKTSALRAVRFVVRRAVEYGVADE